MLRRLLAPLLLMAALAASVAAPTSAGAQTAPNVDFGNMNGQPAAPGANDNAPQPTQTATPAAAN